MTAERWAALREQMQMAGRPSAFAEIEGHVLTTASERDTAVEQLSEKVEQIATLQAQVADLQAKLAANSDKPPEPNTLAALAEPTPEPA